MNPRGFLFILTHWKLVIHILLHTKRFGVNNKWTESFDSELSKANRGLRYFKANYKAAKIRATTCGFLTSRECEDLGWR